MDGNAVGPEAEAKLVKVVPENIVVLNLCHNPIDNLEAGAITKRLNHLPNIRHLHLPHCGIGAGAVGELQSG